MVCTGSALLCQNVPVCNSHTPPRDHFSSKIDQTIWFKLFHSIKMKLKSVGLLQKSTKWLWTCSRVGLKCIKSKHGHHFLRQLLYEKQLCFFSQKFFSPLRPSKCTLSFSVLMKSMIRKHKPLVMFLIGVDKLIKGKVDFKGLQSEKVFDGLKNTLADT